MESKQLKNGVTLHLLWLVFMACACLGVLLFEAGCFIPAISVMGTPTKSEARGSAEYDLLANKGQKILVLVDQPAYLKAPPNLRYFLTDSINKLLQSKAKIPAEVFIDYDNLSDYRANASDFSLLAPQQVGAALGADMVLVVDISDYRIQELSEAGLYSGILDARAYLVGVAAGDKLWPAMEQSRLIQVGFESERRGRDAAVVRLAAAAHCVTRSLYNCPKTQFKIADERTTAGW